MTTAIFTIVRNEAFFLPRWLEHYARTGFELYVLDHESDDGSTSGSLHGATVFPVTRPNSDDVGWLLQTVEAFQRRLFNGGFERVVFAEVDEFLIPDPARWANLGAYLAHHRAAERITATGFDVCWRPPAPALDPWIPVLTQRGWRRNDRYDKTLVARGPVRWEVGFHRPVEGEARPAPDPELLLVHTHYADPTIAWQRLRARQRHKDPYPNDWGRQNKFVESQHADFMADFDAATAGAEPVPDRFRQLL